MPEGEFKLNSNKCKDDNELILKKNMNLNLKKRPSTSQIKKRLKHVKEKETDQIEEKKINP